MGHSFLWVNYQLFSELNDILFNVKLIFENVFFDIFSGRAFQIKEILTSIELQPWLNAAYSVDTFFVIR